ncbi:hypothetical protein QYF36_021382 [Acer negundo]|nr:hypothetical protein QYF36_021382 [Acer negundo]
MEKTCNEDNNSKKYQIINSKRRSGLFMPIDEAWVDSFSWLTTLEGLVDPIHVDAADNDNIESAGNAAGNVVSNAAGNVDKNTAGNVDKNAAGNVDKNPYGLWLMVSYGRQGNQNFRGKNSRSGIYEKNGNARKNVGSISRRRYDGDYTKAKSGLKKGMPAKPVSSGKGTNVNMVNGSRFNILSEEADVMITEEEVQVNSKGSGSIINKNKGKVVLSEITNLKGNLHEKASRNPSQESKKITMKGAKLSTNSGFQTKVTEFVRVNDKSKGNQLVANPIPKDTETEEHDSVKVLDKQHIEAMDINADY